MAQLGACLVSGIPSVHCLTPCSPAGWRTRLGGGVLLSSPSTGLCCLLPHLSCRAWPEPPGTVPAEPALAAAALARPGLWLSQSWAPFLSADRAWRTRSWLGLAHRFFELGIWKGLPALVAVQSPRDAGESLYELIFSRGRPGPGLENFTRRLARLAKGLAAQVACGRALVSPALRQGLPDRAQTRGSVGRPEPQTLQGGACVLLGWRRLTGEQDGRDACGAGDGLDDWTWEHEPICPESRPLGERPSLCRRET